MAGRWWRGGILMAALMLGLAGCAGDGQSVSLAREGFFYAGGTRVAQGGKSLLVDQMFVQYRIPTQQRMRYPIVLLHGNYQNGSNFLGTPDDREGWATYFLRQGYAVYIVDQPARGRSFYDPAVDGPAVMPTADQLERQFTAPERFNLWPQAHLHTQWPGSGMQSDPVFDQFQASQEPSITDNMRMDKINRAAFLALLARIGPVVLLTHSRAGAIGWGVADDAPNLVKALVAVEPSGPPFFDVVPVAMDQPKFARAAGIAYAPLTYDPPVSADAPLDPVREASAQGPGLQACWFATSPHRLTRLAGIPILILTSEASYHAAYDHCTAQYLTKAGVANDFIRLADRGIHGNGHMMMLEKNNLAIAAAIDGWLKAQPKLK